ncbi:hypothetical protein BU23DRAFT_551720 [Bimuria novae-zelandiae CBS 107.79]|uniref:Uncharacterized protein n=1 Tax=Bimuria novae-zelandiae CBS 107.79 TaxID=1447943 RepID=A0A6A5VIK3_9PLEO|nr:hypothetical protein BU23DRAFT_551720 [Bimuria novae-zelandiae CBS 107.79]
MTAHPPNDASRTRSRLRGCLSQKLPPQPSHLAAPSMHSPSPPAPTPPQPQPAPRTPPPHRSARPTAAPPSP